MFETTEDPWLSRWVLQPDTCEGPVHVAVAEDVVAWRAWAYERGTQEGAQGSWAPGGGLLLLVWVWVAHSIPDPLPPSMPLAGSQPCRTDSPAGLRTATPPPPFMTAPPWPCIPTSHLSCGEHPPKLHAALNLSMPVFTSLSLSLPPFPRTLTPPFPSASCAPLPSPSVSCSGLCARARVCVCVSKTVWVVCGRSNFSYCVHCKASTSEACLSGSPFAPSPSVLIPGQCQRSV